MNTPTTDIIYKDCPIRNILSHICGKWALLILYTLHHHGCMRFNSLHKHIPDISQKVLTSTLRSLEADGFVSRKIYAEVPPRVEHPYGKGPVVSSAGRRPDCMGAKQHG